MSNMLKIILRFTRTRRIGTTWAFSVPAQVGVPYKANLFLGNAGYLAHAEDFPEVALEAVWLRGAGSHPRVDKGTIVRPGDNPRSQAAAINRAIAMVRAFVPDTTVEWR